MLMPQAISPGPSPLWGQRSDPRAWLLVMQVRAANTSGEVAAWRWTSLQLPRRHSTYSSHCDPFLIFSH